MSTNPQQIMFHFIQSIKITFNSFLIFRYFKSHSIERKNAWLTHRKQDPLHGQTPTSWKMQPHQHYSPLFQHMCFAHASAMSLKIFFSTVIRSLVHFPGYTSGLRNKEINLSIRPSTHILTTGVEIEILIPPKNDDTTDDDSSSFFAICFHTSPSLSIKLHRAYLIARYQISLLKCLQGSHFWLRPRLCWNRSK